jgi:hypothetical protein
MPEEFSLVEKGISSVLIIDDDWEVNINKNSLIDVVDSKQLDRLDDDDDDDTYALIQYLEKINIPNNTTQEKLNALFDESLRENIPVSYIENIVETAESKTAERRLRLETIKQALMELGLPDESIACAPSVSVAKSKIKNVYPQLFIFDLYLEIGNEDLSIDLLTEVINSVPAEQSPQFILMSYDKTPLTSFFRKLHKKHEISSSKFKVIEKPHPSKIEEDKLRWKYALYLMSLERGFMDIQFNMQQAWVNNIKSTTEKLTQKIWELDSCSLNKLRLTALADSVSMAEYLPEIMSKHIIGEFEESGSPKTEISLLEVELRKVNDHFTFNSSVEVVEPYETLKKLLADIASHRVQGLSEFSSKIEDEDQIIADEVKITDEVKTKVKAKKELSEEEKILIENQSKLFESFKMFITELNFGSIIRSKSDNKILVHLTQPCDYIRVPFDSAANESLLFFPGSIMSLYEEGDEKSTKNFISSYTRVNDEIVSVNWNLRRPMTFSMKDFFIQRHDYQVIGKLRGEYAQAICSKFASGVSKTALIKLPRFEDVECNHIHYDFPTKTLYLTGAEGDIELDKDAPKLSGGISFSARRYKHKNGSKDTHRFTLLSHSAAKVSGCIKGTINENNNVSLELLSGVTLGNETSGLIQGPCGIYFLHEKALSKQTIKNIEAKAKTEHHQSRTLNLVLLRSSGTISE